MIFLKNVYKERIEVLKLDDMDRMWAKKDPTRGAWIVNLTLSGVEYEVYTSENRSDVEKYMNVLEERLLEIGRNSPFTKGLSEEITIDTDAFDNEE